MTIAPITALALTAGRWVKARLACLTILTTVTVVLPLAMQPVFAMAGTL